MVILYKNIDALYYIHKMMVFMPTVELVELLNRIKFKTLSYNNSLFLPYTLILLVHF